MRDPATTYEKLGLFYLGRPYDLDTGAPTPGLTLYDAKDLTTHAICVGMTGSGKTGLCLGLIEEAALDGIPVIAIDPKGDLGNLLLTFPDLAPADFEPWVDPDEAGRKGMSVQEYAADRARLWRSGLAEWHQDATRIQRLREAADFAIYTPGSSAGLQLSILDSFAAPDAALLEDAELLVERVNTTATSLLTLAGIEAEPVRDREHVLVATIVRHAWSQGESLDLTSLIQQIQQPPVTRLGVVDLDAFYPPKDRFELAMRINQLLAAPGFELWLQGEPLDVSRLLYTSEGKPRVSILSIAHLGDAERMSFVSLLLHQVVGWMRAQSGTNSLRALLYMDEIVGYVPPVANPPSKGPLLTLLKQARAYGLGVVLATQNPVDLDYKGLSNAGTWFLGRLQTERDKARVLDGLEGAAAGAGISFDRGQMEKTLAGLSSRVFVMHNVHDDAAEVFETRWVMSYLRGPLTRRQIQELMRNRKASGVDTATAVVERRVVSARRPPPGAGIRPILPPEVPQYFVPIEGHSPARHEYTPVLYAAATVEFVDRKLDVNDSRDVAFIVPMQDGPATLDWDEAEATKVTPSDLETEPEEGVPFADVPAAAGKKGSYARWERELKRWLARTQTLDLLACTQLKMVSRPGESERDFRIRLRDRAHELRDEKTVTIRARYASKVRTLTDRVRRAEQAVARETEQASHQKLQTALSFGAAVLSAVMGRKAATRSTLGRATTAARGVGRSIKETEDIARAKESVETLSAQLADLEAELRDQVSSVEARFDPLGVDLAHARIDTSTRRVTPTLIALSWHPVS